MRRSFAFFDVDGTLWNLSSMFSFARFHHIRRSRFLRRLLLALLASRALRRLPREIANRLFYLCFAGERPEEVRADISEWYATLPSRVLNELAVEALERLRDLGVDPVMVSGSSDDIVRPLAEELGIEHVLATRPEVVAGRYNGRIQSPQTIGEGKRRAVLDFLSRNRARPESCYAFGDHLSDLPMLEAVGHPVVVPGDPALCELARARAWPLLPGSSEEAPTWTLPILIVGAGPAGLVCAIQLARAGIPFRLIEEKDRIDSRSKALSINSATLELFADLGVIEAIMALARVNETIRIHWKGSPLHEISLAGVPSDYPYFATLPQYETEAILRARLKELGGSAETRAALVGLRPESDRVFAEIQLAGGEREIAAFDFVLGCDGSRSSVRELSDIPFEGDDYDMHFIMCDAELTWSGAKDALHYWVEEESFAIVIPLTESLHRIVIKVSGPLDPDRVWTRADFHERLADMGLGDVTLGEPAWTNQARFYNRLAAEFQRGRVFLVGDAAHLFSPIGGQGMNTGVQDAYNLAWKLALVRTGRAGEELLQTYGVERRKLAEQLREATDSMTRVIARIDCAPRGPLADFLPEARGGEFLERTLPERLAGTSATYASPLEDARHGDVVTGDRLSRAAPAFDCAPLHDPEGRRFTLVLRVGDGGWEGVWLEAVARLQAEFEAELQVVPAVATSGAAPSVAPARALLVRPDRFIAFVGPCQDAADVAAIRRKLFSLLGRSSSHSSQARSA
jgi:HAD superfamily hydrolase (TIGR01490 family)